MSRFGGYPGMGGGNMNQLLKQAQKMQADMLKTLMKLGYKRSTMVSDISEFSIRGDITDVYSLTDNPVRIEFWGDEIVDIRFFDRECECLFPGV